MAVIVESIGIGEVGIDGAQLGCAPVHFFSKGFDAAGYQLGQSVGHLIGGWKQKSVQAVPHGKLLTHPKPDMAAAGLQA